MPQPHGHRALSEEVHRTNSLLSLITLDLEFEKPPSEDLEIIVDAAPDNSIRAILKSLGFGGSPEDLERVTAFCSGYPRELAVLVSSALKEGAEHFADFKDNDNFVSRLVWGHGQPNLDLMRCLRCLALFEAVGVSAPKDGELAWIALHLLGLQPAVLEGNLEHFYNGRVLQKRGYSVAVLPRPLAAQLSALYWKNATDAQKQIIVSGQMPDALITALCNRLPDISNFWNMHGRLPESYAINPALSAQRRRSILKSEHAAFANSPRLLRTKWLRFLHENLEMGISSPSE